MVAGRNRYQMRQKMVAIGDDFWIENEQSHQVFKVVPHTGVLRNFHRSRSGKHHHPGCGRVHRRDGARR